MQVIADNGYFGPGGIWWHFAVRWMVVQIEGLPPSPPHIDSSELGDPFLECSAPLQVSLFGQTRMDVCTIGHLADSVLLQDQWKIFLAVCHEEATRGIQFQRTAFLVVQFTNREMEEGSFFTDAFKSDGGSVIFNILPCCTAITGGVWCGKRIDDIRGVILKLIAITKLPSPWLSYKLSRWILVSSKHAL